MDSENYAQAKKYFEALVSVDDKLYEGYFGYIYSLVKMGNIELAQNLIRTMSSLAPDNGEVNYILSLICEASGDYKDAFDYIQNAIKKEKNSLYYVEAGKLGYILGNYDDSIKYLSPVINNKTAQEYLLLNYARQNNIAKIKEILASSTALDKNRIIYKYYLYKIYQSNSNIELNSLLRQKLVKIEDYIDIAQINVLEKRDENARKILNNAFKKFKNSPEIKCALQEILYKK